MSALLLQVLSLLLNLFSSKIIFLPIQKNSNSYEIFSTLDFSRDNISFNFDLTSNYTLFWNRTFPSPYQHVINGAVKIKLPNSLQVVAQEILNTFFLAPEDPKVSISIHFYPFFYFSNETNQSLQFSNHIGLSHHYDNYSYSIVHHIKKQGLIDHLTFSFIQGIDNNRYIYLGGLLQDIIDNYYHSNCSVDQAALSWECELSEVVIDYNSRLFTYQSPVKNIISFEGPLNSISCPKSFLTFFIDEVIKYGVYSEQCTVTVVNSTRSICCTIDYALKKGSVSFQIEHFNYTFELKSVWKCTTEYCHLNMIENSDNKDKWTVGALFFESLTLQFDYDGSLIHFYSNEGRIRSNSKAAVSINSLKQTIRSCLVGSLISMEVLAIFLLLLIKFQLQVSHNKR